MFDRIKNIFGRKENMASRWAGHSYGQRDLNINTKAFHTNMRCSLPDNFFERDEISTISQFIGKKNVVVLYGIGGLGKTTILTKICENKPCGKIAYYDLKNKDSFISVAKSILREVFLETILPDSEDELIKLLMKYVEKEQTLIIFDNMESIMGIGCNSGKIHSLYFGYHKFIQAILGVKTCSTIIVSGRERLDLGNRNDSRYIPIRLSGINVEQAKVLLNGFNLSGTNSDWKKFVETYSGNALTLKIVASEISEFYDKSLTDFLLNPNMPHELLELLNEQFERFTDTEKIILLISAIEREPVDERFIWNKLVGININFNQLHKLFSNVVNHCFFEKNIYDDNKSYYLQPVIMEFLTQKLIDTFVEEINDTNLNYIAKVPLIDTYAKEYILDIQKSIIVQPLISILLQKGESKCQRMLLSLAESIDLTKSYATGNIIILLSAFNEEISDCDFSEKYIMNTDLRNVKLRNCDFTNSKFENVLMKNTFGNLIDVKYTYNDSMIIGGATDYSLNAWDCHNMSYEFKLRYHTDWVRSVDSNAFYYASASNDEYICVYDRISRNPVAQFYAGSRVRKVFLPNDSDKYVISSGDDGVIRKWDIIDNSCITFRGHKKVVWDLEVVDINGKKFIISVSDDKRAILWDVDGKNKEVICEYEYEMKSIAFSKKGQLFIGCENGDIIIFSLVEKVIKNVLKGHEGIIWGLDYDEINNKMISAASDKHVIVWDCSEDIVRKIKVMDAHNSAIWNINFNNSGTQFVTTGDDSEFKVWDAVDYKLLYCVKGYTNLLRNLYVCQQNKSLFVAGDDMIIREYSLDDVEKPRKFYMGHSNRVRHLDVSPNGNYLVSCGDDGNVILWGLKDGSKKIFRGHKKRVWTVCFINEQEFASAGEENDIYIWNKNSLTPQRMSGHSNWIWDLTFHSKKNYMISSSEDNTCKLWDMNTRTIIFSFEDHTKWLFAASFSPSGNYIVTASADNKAIIYDIIKKEKVCSLEGHSGWVWSTVFIDENTIATGSQDSSIRIWKIDYEKKTYECVHILNKHLSWVVSLDYDTRTHLMYSASADETVKIWYTANYQYKMDVRIDKPYDGIRIKGVKGLTDSERMSLLQLGAIE